MAADLRTLEREINQLQEQVEQQKKEADRIRQQSAADYRRQLEEYRVQMKTVLDEHDAGVQREYERLLRQYQDSVDKEIRDEQLRMDMQYRNLLASTREKEQKWLEKSREMEELIVQLRQSTENKAKVSRREAEEYLKKTDLLYKEVEKLPQERFFAGRLSPLFTALCEGRDLYKAGLFEAAIAVAISARTGLCRLKLDIEEAFAEWQRQYYLWKNKTGLLHLQLMDEAKIWFDEINGEGKLNKEQEKRLRTEINYWSKGEYGGISNKIAPMGREIDKVEKNGGSNYLKTPDSVDTEKIKEYIKELDKLTEQTEQMRKVYKSRYRAACQRSEWGENIIGYFEDELNLSFLENIGGFRRAEKDITEKASYKQYMEMQYGAGYDKVDTREWLELIFENPSGTRIMLYIVPYEMNSYVENRIILYIDFETAEDPDYARQILSHTANALKSQDAEEIVTFADNAAELTLSQNPEIRAAGRLIEKRIKERTK